MRRLTLSIQLAIISIGFGLFLFAGTFSGVAAAQDYGPYETLCSKIPSNQTKPAVCTQPNKDPITGADGILIKASKILIFIIGFVSVIMIIVGGLRYILANGDSTAINGAKNQILYAMAGVVIAVSAQAIIVFVVNRL